MKRLAVHLVVITLFCFSCKQANKQDAFSSSSLETYYYPISDISHKRVYCYNYKANNQNYNVFDVLWVEQNNDKVLVHMETYSPTLEPTDYFIFEANEKGVYLKKHTQRRREPRISQEYESEVILNTVQKWSRSEKDTLEYQNNYHTVLRIREYKGKVNDVVFNGEKHEAIQYLDAMSFRNQQGELTNQLKRTAIYCKDMGLYSCTYKYNDGRIFKKELKEIISFEEWKKRTSKINNNTVL